MGRRFVFALFVICFLPACSSTGFEDAGGVRVIVVTTGDNLPDAYELEVEGLPPANIAANGTLEAAPVEPGTRTVELSDVPGNCTVQADNPRALQITANTITETTFDVTCV